MVGRGRFAIKHNETPCTRSVFGLLSRSGFYNWLVLLLYHAKCHLPTMELQINTLGPRLIGFYCPHSGCHIFWKTEVDLC